MTKPHFKVPSALGKFSPKKPVFNQPVSLQHHHKISRTIHAVVLPLLIIISIVVIVLKALTINFIEDNRDTGFEFQNQEQNVIMAALPKHLHTTPAKLALVSSAISTFVSIGHLLFIVMDWREGKKTQAYAFRRNIMFVHFSNSILILFALVSLYMTHKSSSHFSERYINFKADLSTSSEDGMRYNRGTFDLETWSCELATVPGASMVSEDYGRQCAAEIAGRGMMIPWLILGWGLTGLSIWGMIGGWRDANGQRVKTNSVEMELGKMRATDED
ncbi:hypothetical protein DM02DRAFT_511908 [Periconia macrospinosa]|uniref:Uncharacterized protein n=1 Tax=Periconia macrospinosa TaxID=97972 RepID=A0A2V1EDX8_9PLEO|nr:hypothetical protein DM02DRAFT_511908 [Periconia macrospinosa]